MTDLAASTSQPLAQPRTFRLSWQLVALAAIVILAGVLRLTNLDMSSNGNQYYTAAVEAMRQSPANFFFAAAEPGGGVSVDKPPFGLWVQTISAMIFGVNNFGVTLPSIVAGMLSVALIYHLVSKRFGAFAGLIAAFVLATTPISIAVDRTNNLDSILIFVLLLAAWAFIRAVETRKLAPLLIGAALVGVGFNTKMLQAYLILPALYAFYFLGAHLKWGKKIVYLAGAGIVLLVVSLSWALIVDLTPADQRPYVGGSQTNSVIELALGYNGLQRITGANRGSGQVSPPQGMRGGEIGEPGLLRMFSAPLQNELSWALPLALLMLVILLFSERIRLPLGEKHQSIVLWGGWLLTGLAFFTVSEFFHAYYLATIAPPIAALIGIGAVTVWQSNRARLFTVILIGGAAGTLVYQWVTADTYGTTITPSRFAAVIALALGIVTFAVSFWLPKWRHIAVPALVSSALIIPATWGVLTAQNNDANAALPSAYTGTRSEGMGRARLSSNTGENVIDPILAYLTENQTSKYLIAVSSSMIGAPVVLETGKPVLYIGGFNGGDLIYTGDDIAAMVASGELRYFLTGGTSIDQWVMETCAIVDEISIEMPGFPRPSGGNPPGRGSAAPALYDCQPAA